MPKNGAGEGADNLPLDRADSSSRPNVPRLLTIIGLAIVAWAIVIAIGIVGWSAIAFLIGY
jgi:hypothetical protein